MVLVVKNLPVDVGDISQLNLPMWVLFLGWEDPLEEGMEYSCLENPIDRKAWWTIVHIVTKIQSGLNDSTHVNHGTSRPWMNCKVLSC